MGAFELDFFYTSMYTVNNSVQAMNRSFEGGYYLKYQTEVGVSAYTQFTHNRCMTSATQMMAYIPLVILGLILIKLVLKLLQRLWRICNSSTRL